MQAFPLGHLSGRIRDEGAGRKSGAAGCSEEFLVCFWGRFSPKSVVLGGGGAVAGRGALL